MKGERQVDEEYGSTTVESGGSTGDTKRTNETVKFIRIQELDLNFRTFI